MRSVDPSEAERCNYSTVLNQDDCLAINKGSNIVFQGNTCSGGHGISIVCPVAHVLSSRQALSDGRPGLNQQRCHCVRHCYPEQ